MDKDPKEAKNLGIAEKLAPLAEALYKSEYPNILLYENDEYFTGECDGQLYDNEVIAIQDAILATGILQEDDLMPVVISSNLRSSTNALYTKVLENRCAFGDCWNISLSVAYTKDFKHCSNPVLQIKYCNEKEKTAQVNSGLDNLFEIEKMIFMRRLVSKDRIRPRVKYSVR